MNYHPHAEYDLIDYIALQSLTTTKSLLWRGRVSLTRHNIEFPIPLPSSTLSDHLNPDKEKLRETIFDFGVRAGAFARLLRRLVYLDAGAADCKP
jgi:hypothetical protein